VVCWPSLTALGSSSASAKQITTVFVIAMETHNWTQPANQFTGGIQQIYQNPNAPFINSLVNGTAFAVIDGAPVDISEQVAYATAYHNVLATPGGNNPIFILPSPTTSGRKPAPISGDERE
jgi:phosphatidylinositol-3-phosphatase